MGMTGGFSAGTAGRRVKKTNVTTAVLVITILVVIGFLWFYIRRLNPLDGLWAAFKPVRHPPEWIGAIYGDKNVFLKQPRAVYVHNGEIYVSDTGNHRVVVFDAGGRYLRKFGDSGKQDAQLIFPYGLTVVDREILVADAGLNRVAVFDMQGSFKRFFPVKVSRPVNVVHHGGRLYFTDVGQQQVIVTDTGGRELWRTGRSGRKEPGEFYYPNGLAVNNEGEILVADTNNARLQLLTPRGQVADIWEGGAAGDASFVAPTSLALDREGNVYVADPIGNRISIVDSQGVLLDNLRQAKPEGGDSLSLPTGVWVDEKQHLYVADYSNSRVVIYDLL